MSRIAKFPSLWALAAAIVLFLLQLLPIPGVFLMMFGAGLITVLLIHVALISLFVEAAIGRLPRILMVVPALVYGGYYVAYWQEGREIAERAAALRAANPGKVLDFDPESHSLVGKDKGSLVQTHDIPVVYETNANFKPEDYLSFRLMRRDQCDGIKRDTQGRILITYVSGKFHLCVLRFPETPERMVVTVSQPKDPEIWKRKPGVTESLTEIVVDGKVIGSYRSAVAWRLPALPYGFVGCGLVSSKPAWECGADFMRKFETLDTIPDGIDKAQYDTPESIMLGLRKYTAADLANFKGFAQNDAILTQVRDEPRRVEDEAFAVLQEMLSGQDPKTSWGMTTALARHPDRLVPLTDKMASRFLTLLGDNKTSRSNATSILQEAIVSLPQPAFQSVAAAMFDIVQNDKAQGDFGDLAALSGTLSSSGGCRDTDIRFLQAGFLERADEPHILAEPAGSGDLQDRQSRCGNDCRNAAAFPVAGGRVQPERIQDRLAGRLEEAWRRALSERERGRAVVARPRLDEGGDGRQGRDKDRSEQLHGKGLGQYRLSAPRDAPDLGARAQWLGRGSDQLTSAGSTH